MIKFVMTKARIKRPSYKHMDIYIYIQGRIQDLALGGRQIGREAPEKFFVPPLSSSGGGQSPP